MYERLPLDFIGVTDTFGERKDPITFSTSYHYGVDLGWNKYQGEPIYAIYDSTVVLNSYDNNLGNYLVLTYDKNDKTIIYRFLHLKEKPNLKEGQKITRGSIVGKMGSTGYSTGVHLHFEYWICPKGYKYNYNDRSKYAKNPLDYCYLFENQGVSNDTKNQVIKVVGESLKQKKNINDNQVEVVTDLLRCRTSPNLKGNVLGYIDYGIYNFLEEQETDGYKWYKIDDNKWIANDNNSFKVYYKNETPKIDINNYNNFIALKDDYYYIYLKKDENIYYPKKN